MSPMAIGSRLSRKIHEVLGTEAAEAMVDWMQRVDAGRSELRELNDLSFARFDARLAERIAEVNARMDIGFANVDAKLANLEARTDAKFSSLETKIDAKIANLESRMDATLARHRADLLKWSFAFWVTALIGIAAAVRH